jgi:NADH-quinone oxidoreductase subunit C
MTAKEIHSSLQSLLPAAKIEFQQGQAGDPWLLVQSADLIQVIQILKNNLGMNYLACLSGIDYETALGVVYQIRSLTGKFDVMIKVLIPKDNPVLSSLTKLYPAAEWFEREAYDLVGIQFQGHPDLRRIMMPDDWIGYPLRKDYQAPADYHGIPCDRPDPHQLLVQLRTTSQQEKTVDPAGGTSAANTPAINSSDQNQNSTAG